MFRLRRGLISCAPRARLLSTPLRASAAASTVLASRVRPAVSIAKRTYFEWSTSVSTIKNWTQHEGVASWILDRIRLAQPQRVHLCDGSERENTELLQMMTQSGTLIKLNDSLRPNSYLARSPTSDVARVEERTFICSENKADAGFTNNWTEPEEMQNKLNKLFEGCMRGRTMYVVPFSMGPIGSPFSQLGVQITDSPYVVASMRVMTRMGKEALDQLGTDGDFVPCTHSVGMPLQRGQEDVPWPCSPDPTNKWIVHFPEQRRIWSYGSNYGGNALLGKKCLALRIGSVMGKEDGWLAEHMLIVGITNPQGVKKYIAAAFPSACGKTNLAMMLPKLPGWKMTTVGDDIAWMRIGKDGRLWAVNPEAGFFGVAPGTSDKTNPMCMATMNKNTIFTNVGLKRDGDVWWEGMTDKEPEHVQSWLRVEKYSDSGFEAAHPNSRFTVPASQCPIIDEQWDGKEGVPISAIIFGGRRSSTVPLVYQARDWNHGTFLGAMMNSETTAAAVGKRGVLRADPFAMRPFCGYNMGDYFGHWLSFAGRTEPAKLPKIFHVNWFRKGAKGKFLWPGFGDNVRVLKWIFDRCDAKGNEQAVETPIGTIPAPGSLDLSGLQGVDEEAMNELFHLDTAEWKGEVTRARGFFANFKDRLPAAITAELDKLDQRLDASVKK